MIRYLYLAGCLLINITLKAQAPVAAFTASTVSGCAPLTVVFTDQSTNSPKYWNWQFGGTGQLSSIQNPAITFPTPGIYSVTLVVRNSDGTDGVTRTNYITVSPSPSPGFTASLNTACTPASIQFTDNSLPAGSITSYEWGFTDGTTSTLQNPSKLYTTTGYHGVFLTVTTTNGCKASTGNARFIRIINGIKPDFNFTRQGACTFPINTNFLNQTSGPGTLTYAWDFGDGNTSSVKSPSNSYAATGTYNVKLQVKSDYGCENTITKPVTFGATNTQISAPASSCPNKAVNFVNSSTPAPLSSSWDFGDGTTSTQTNPSKIFTVPGTYMVTLVSKSSECEGIAFHSITITNQPAVDFTSLNATGCKVPYTVDFQNASPDAVSYLWNFGDGSTSTAQNPSHTYNRTGNFNVTLSIVTSGGCPATITKPSFASVNTSLSININGVPKEGCVPLSFSPTATVNTPGGVSAYLWTFGNGNTSTLAAPTTTYVTGGTYDVKVKITTPGGCVDSVTSIGAVKAGSLPVADFTFTPTADGCAGIPITFSDLSNPVDKWLWDFGDGQTSETKNPVHLFADTGILAVSLTAFNSGCQSLPVTKTMPRRIGPVAKFETNVNCLTPAASRLTVNFINQSIINPLEAASTTYLWNFGSGGNTSTLENPPPFTYPAAGPYTVSLTITGPLCSYTLIKNIDLRVQTADFKINDADICPYQLFKIETINTNPNEIKSYTWQIGGGTSFIEKSSFDTSFSIKGNYPVTLTIVDTFGCTNSKTIPSLINIVGAEADFSVINNGGCANADITFTDLSTSPITTKWTFDYGNGQIKSYTAPPFTQKYANSGDYPVFLYIEDSYGCKDTTSNLSAVHITKNIANFGAEDSVFCAGGPLQFRDSSIGSNLTYTWTFGDNTTDNAPNPIHAYPRKDTTYSVKLHITDAVGCADSLTRTKYIRIVSPKPRFDAQDTVSLCPPLQTIFNSTSKDYDSLYWSFGDGNTSNLDTAANFYNNYGTYVAKLYTLGYGGCLDSASINVRILNPSVDVQIVYNSELKCDSLDVQFQLTIPDNIRFYLYFNDREGQIDSSGNKIINHMYRGAGLYRPSLLLRDALGCDVGLNGAQQILINGAIPLFNMDKKSFCDNGQVFFTDFTIGNDPVVSKSWDFGDGTPPSPLDNPSHTFTQPGTFIVKHSVVTQTGCNSVFPDTVRVYRTPDITITGNNNVCINNTLILKAGTVVPDTAISWKWTIPGNTSTDSVIAIKPSAAGTIDIKLDGATKIGCASSYSTQITVNPLPVITMPPSITTPLGNTIAIPVTYNDPVLTYLWTPATYLNCTDCAVPSAVNPKFATTYKVKVTDNNNCVSKDTIQLNTVCNGINYFVPNTFSPNGDGANDWFYPRGTFLNNIQSLRIFNRWGEMVFEKRNFAPNNMIDGWNGLYKGKPAAADVYVYIMELICENAQIIPIKGDVTLIR